MMMFLTVLWYLLLTILFILIMVLVIPFEYQIRGERYGSTRLELRASWLFNAVCIRFTMGLEEGFKLKLSIFGFKPNISWGNKKDKDSKNDKAEKKKQNKEKKKQIQEKKKMTNKKKKGKNKGHRDVTSYIDRDLITRTLRLVKQLLSSIKPHLLFIEGKYGFDDPYYTGITHGYLATFGFNVGRGKINLTAIYDEEVLEGRFLIRGRIILAVLVGFAVRFVFSKPVRNILIKRMKG